MNKKLGNCDVCEKPVYQSDNYQQGFFGEIAHAACLDTVPAYEEEEERGD